MFERMHGWTDGWRTKSDNSSSWAEFRWAKNFMIKSPWNNVADLVGVIMDMILMEMLKMWKVNDRHKNERRTIVNWPRHKLMWSKAPGELPIKDLNNGCCDSHRGHRNKMVLAILHVITMSPQCLPLSFGSICLTIREQIRFEDFKMATSGAILVIGTTLAILNLYVTPIPPIKFGLNQHYGLGGDVVWRISRWPLWQPSWMSEWNEFSSSESPCLPNASYQVST